VAADALEALVLQHAQQLRLKGRRAPLSIRLTTQLFFDDTLTTAIVASQPIYDARGARDTTNQNDGVISAAAVGDYLLSTQKMIDGAMLSWKTIVLRSSLSESLCTAPGGTMSGGGPGGDGGPGGPPLVRG
jgi:hypothetical protein